MNGVDEIIKQLEAIKGQLDDINGPRPEVLDLATLSRTVCVCKRKLEELIDHPTNPLRPHLFKIDGLGKWFVERDEAISWFRRFRTRKRNTDEEALKQTARVKIHRSYPGGG